MRSPLPPLDAHAHIEPTIAPAELTKLRAVVFAVTREPREWEAARRRNDRTTVWGVGCHPGVPAALGAFDPDQFSDAIADAPLVGEVGVDGRSKVPMARQREVLDRILAMVGENPRPVSLHSVNAADAVLDALRKRPVPGAILHWWRGSAAQTETAVEMGCFFSLNGAEVKNPKVLDLLPRDRVLTETDFPHSRRSDRAANRPGQVDTIEKALAVSWGEDLYGVRTQIWANLRALLDATGVTGRMPRDVKTALLTARRPA